MKTSIRLLVLRSLRRIIGGKELEDITDDELIAELDEAIDQEKREQKMEDSDA